MLQKNEHFNQRYGRLMENQVIHNACPTGYGLDFVILFTTLCTSVCLLGFYLRLNPQVIQCITAYTARLLSPCLAIAERAVQRVPLAWRDSANKTPQWYTTSFGCATIHWRFEAAWRAGAVTETTTGEKIVTVERSHHPCWRQALRSAKKWQKRNSDSLFFILPKN